MVDVAQKEGQFGVPNITRLVMETHKPKRGKGKDRSHIRRLAKSGTSCSSTGVSSELGVTGDLGLRLKKSIDVNMTEEGHEMLDTANHHIYVKALDEFQVRTLVMSRMVTSLL